MKKARTLLLAAGLLLATLPSLAQWTTSGNDIYNSNSGNVGIGNSSPAAKLHVNGTTFISGATTIDNNLTMTGTSLIIGHATQAGQVVMSLRQSSNASSGWNIGYTSYNNNDLYMYGFENSAFRLYTNAAERLTVTGAGNVGIGTTTPAYKLDVNGTLNSASGITMGSSIGGSWVPYGTWSQFSSNTSTDAIDIIAKKSTSDIFLRVNNGGRGISLRGSSGNFLFMGGSGETLSGIGNDNGTGNLTFLYSTGANSQTEGARLTNAGNFGIGTSTPSTKLEVNGSVKIVTGNPGSFTVGNYSSLSHISYDGSTGLTSFYMLRAGNLQTQTNGETRIMGDVNERLLFLNGSYIAGYQSPVMIKRVWSGVGAATLVLDDEGGVTASTYKILQAKFNGTEMAYIKGDGGGYFAGDVGIGTTSPSASLHVAGNFILANGTQGAGKVLTSNASGLASWADAPAGSQWISNGSDIYYNAGKVGIGTSTPAHKLDLIGNQRVLGTIGVGTSPNNNGMTINTSTGYFSGYGLQVTGDYGGFNSIRIDNTNAGASSTAGVLMVNNANYGAFIRIDGTTANFAGSYPGHLNIQAPHSGIRYVSNGIATGNPSHIFYTGNPSPLERLRVDNNGVTVSNGYLMSAILTGGTASTSMITLKATSGNATTDTGIKMLVGNNGATEAMRILNNGNILIGTTQEATDYKLAVKGNIIAEKVRVKLQSSGWPDYVFNHSYNLPTLKEIEQYIQQNQHLPGVPSAATIEKEGLDLGDGQAVLLQKIEELTLHMIEMNKRVEKLEKENELLKKKIQKD